jgi:AP-2 complex subunit alpha
VSSLDGVKRHTDTILSALRDKDISVRRRGLDLLYFMCDESNSRRIVAELLQYLAASDLAIREELVLKIAILAERFATEYSWYVDVVLQLISAAGDHVSEEIWYRVVQIVTNNPELQPYAARTVLKALTSPTWHETAVKVAAYVLGEYGDFIANEAGSSPIEQFRALHTKFGACSLPTRAILLSTYIKFANLFPEIRNDVDAVFKQYADVLDVEVQQRACEYLAITHATQAQLLEIVCEEMPPFQEKAESALVSLVKKKEGDTTDRRTIKALDRKRGATKTSLTSFGGATPPARAGSAGPTAIIATPPPISASAAAAPAAAAPPAAKTAPTTSALVDLLGLEVDNPPAPAPAPTASAFASAAAGGAVTEVQVTAGSERWLFKTLGALSGVLYEDAEVQIGLKSEYQGPKGRLGLFFGNKTAEPFAPFAATVVAPAGTGLSITVQQAAPPSVAPRTQAMQALLVACDGEFATLPLLSVVMGTRRLVLRLPVLPTRFALPVQLPSADFFNRWKQIGGGDREAICDGRVASGALNGDAARAVLAGFNIAVLDGIDPNPANFVGASIFAPAAEAKCGLLVRVQVNPSDPVCVGRPRAERDRERERAPQGGWVRGNAHADAVHNPVWHRRRSV